MSIDMPNTPNHYEQMLREWLSQPKNPPHPDKVVHPLELFRYPGGYRIGAGQKPKMIRRPKRSYFADRRTHLSG